MSVGEGYHDGVQNGWSDERHLRLPADVRSVKVARDEVAAILEAHHWPGHAVDQARVVTSELVTNAVLHTEASFGVSIRVRGGAHLSVTDGRPDRWPRFAPRDDGRPGGMGLYLVDAMAAAWGVYQEGEAKVVWADLAAPAR